MNKYEQIRINLINGDRGRCVMGAILNEYGSPSNVTHDFTSSVWDSVIGIHNIDKPTRNFSRPYNNKESYIDRLKETHKETGRIQMRLLTTLNDSFGTTFEEFRDIFYEMDV
jgi:superoxide dismutase